MRYEEKDFAPVDVHIPDIFINPPKLPYGALRTMARLNLRKLREGMGGNARDIVRRPIRAAQHEIAGFSGQVRLLVYMPEETAALPRPLLIFCHGGGWFGGSTRTVEPFCRAVADRGDAVVVSVDYHLCPEHPFPHGLEDCYRAAQWACVQPTLGIDPGNVTIGGDSSGGNFAAVIAQMAQARSDLRIDKQLLLYPAVTLQNFVSPAGGDSGLFGRLLADWYLGGAVTAADPRVSPLLAPSLAGLPQALIVAGERDGLKQQNIAYAQRLSDADVDTTFLLYKGTQHGFIDNTGTQPAAEDLVGEVARFLNPSAKP